MDLRELSVGCFEYDHVRPLFEGKVGIAGHRAKFEGAQIVSEIFEKMLREHAYDVSEMGLTFYLRTLDLDEPPFVAIPVFTCRQFRHSAVFINMASGIRRPADLNGKVIGEFGIYGHDAGVWPKGILADEYGFKPESCRWIIGGADQPIEPYDFVPQPHPTGMEVSAAPNGKALGPMLDAGEIDAFISAVAPRCILDGSSTVAPLFPDYDDVERNYFSRTGIFPIMHTVVIRRPALAENPGLARAVFEAFQASKEATMDRYRKGRMEQHVSLMIPWFTPLFDDNQRLFGDNWWPYGVAANRKTIDTYLRYFFEQGLSPRRRTCEDIFVPELLST